MAIGDEFDINKVKAYDWAVFVDGCGLEPQLVAREVRMTGILRSTLDELCDWPGYLADECTPIYRIAEFALAQAERLEVDAKQLPEIILDTN